MGEIEKEKRLHIRIDDVIHQQIKEKAKKENRSISNYVINLIKKDIEKDEK